MVQICVFTQPLAGANRRWRCQFRYRGSHRESAVAQLFSLGQRMTTRVQVSVVLVLMAALCGCASQSKPEARSACVALFRSDSSFERMGCQALFEHRIEITGGAGSLGIFEIEVAERDAPTAVSVLRDVDRSGKHIVITYPHFPKDKDGRPIFPQ